MVASSIVISNIGAMTPYRYGSRPASRISLLVEAPAVGISSGLRQQHADGELLIRRYVADLRLAIFTGAETALGPQGA